jgi:hypothetical protein
VYGIHTLLWALDTALRSNPTEVQNLRVRFHQPLYLGETAALATTGRTQTSLDLEVTMDGIVIAAIRASSLPGKSLATAARFARSEVERLAAPADTQIRAGSSSAPTPCPGYSHTGVRSEEHRSKATS